MSALVFYGLKTCDSCRKARKALTEAGYTLTYIDVRDDGLDPKLLQQWASQVGTDTMLNTRSTTWRELPPAKKTDLSDKQKIALLAEHPTLLKRPLIIKGKDITIGWSTKTREQFLT